jgi:hypothetical protein
MSYIKLAKAKHTELREALAGEEQQVLDMYVAAVDEHDELVYAEQLENAQYAIVECVAVIGNEQRCFATQTEAYEDAHGTIWLDESMHEEVFC